MAAPLPGSSNIPHITSESSVQAPPLRDDVKELLDRYNNKSKDNGLQKEFVDPIDIANEKIIKFVEHLVYSKYTVLFSGAGISTNTKRLADFLGDNGLIANREPLIKMGIAEQKMDSIMPTFTHLCIKKLMEHRYIKKIITSNHDGLHNKSGVEDDDIIDLFGNVYVEKCRKCKKRYYRKSVVSHLYRKCDKYPDCKGKLKRTACNMNESVDSKQFKRAQETAAKSTLSLVLGSSMTIYPFCDLPPKASDDNDQDKMGYVLVTRQETDYDRGALLCIHMNVDDFMLGVMRRLNLQDECAEFVYEQVFDANVNINDDMVVFGLRSRQINEGLPFVASGSVQIVKGIKGDHNENVEDEKKGNDDNEQNEEDKDRVKDDCDIIKEYELQKLKDLNFSFEIMKSSFLDALKKDKEYRVRIEIEWESGFNLDNCRQIFDGIDWGKQGELQKMEMKLSKTVVFDV